MNELGDILEERGFRTKTDTFLGALKDKTGILQSVQITIYRTLGKLQFIGYVINGIVHIGSQHFHHSQDAFNLCLVCHGCLSYIRFMQR